MRTGKYMPWIRNVSCAAESASCWVIDRMHHAMAWPHPTTPCNCKGSSLLIDTKSPESLSVSFILWQVSSIEAECVLMWLPFFCIRGYTQRVQRLHSKIYGSHAWVRIRAHWLEFIRRTSSSFKYLACVHEYSHTFILYYIQWFYERERPDWILEPHWWLKQNPLHWVLFLLETSHLPRPWTIRCWENLLWMWLVSRMTRHTYCPPTVHFLLNMWLRMVVFWKVLCTMVRALLCHCMPRAWFIMQVE